MKPIPHLYLVRFECISPPNTVFLQLIQLLGFQ